jgi:hypothetical protein
MAQIDFPIFPAEFIALDRFDNARKIKNIHAPLLIVNRDRDTIIPPSQGRQLYMLANDPREFYSLPNHGHNDLFEDFAPLSIEWLKQIRTNSEQ